MPWYKYRAVYTYGPRDWKYVKMVFSIRKVREVLMEDSDVNVFSKDFKHIDIEKLVKPPIEAVEQTIKLVEDTIENCKCFLGGLQKDLKKVSKHEHKRSNLPHVPMSKMQR